VSVIRTDVLIVGAGPVGLLTALLLEKVGLDYLLVEHRPSLHTAPQAHVITSRSLEICRSIGISDMPIRAAGPQPNDAMNIRWVDRLAGRDLGVFSLGSDPRAIQSLLSNTPTPTTNLSQDQFEQLLYEHLPEPAKVRFGYVWESAETSEQGLVSTLTGTQGDSLEVESRYLIGADGAGSRVRKSIGANMIGPDNLQTFVNIHFTADLREHLRGREGLLYWVMEKECEGTFIAHDIDSNWIFMKTVDADESIDPINEEKFSALLRKAIGADVDLTINSMNAWRMTAQISDAYQSGRIFLVGDAAHRFPPTGGIGMNTGFQDAHNLVWKIAMVERGLDPVLLETYEVERKPVAEMNSEQSLANAMKMSEVAQVLDADGDKQITMSDLDLIAADAESCANVQQAIDRQAAHFNMSGLDLGFCYKSNAVRVNGAPPQSDDPVSEYLPSTTPGARMPHAWLLSGVTRQSTLDLIKCDHLLVLATTPVIDIKKVVDRLREADYLIDLVPIGDGTDLQPADGRFEELFKGSVLLVRPDGHIAACFTNASAADELGDVVSTLFPRSWVLPT
jgi:2,4-dichlorophenol 6-monooxygenase